MVKLLCLLVETLSIYRKSVHASITSYHFFQMYFLTIP